jgi:hypothetical protein
MNTPTLTQLTHAVKIAEQIAALERELGAILGNHSASVAKAAPAPVKTGTFKRSAATIAKMKASQQARWAKVKVPAVSKTPVRKKSKMSAAGRANIKAAQKKRWAKIHAAKKAPAPKVVVKKRNPMSAEAKARLSAMMKAKWAAKQAATAPETKT